MCAKTRYNSDEEEVEILISRSRSYGSVADMKKPKDETVRLRIDKKSTKRSFKTKKPDGGWGWLVVIGVAVSNMTCQALLSVFGLLFIQRLKDLGIKTTGAATMMSVQTCTLNLSGLVTGPITRRLSLRSTCTLGGSFVVIGLLLTIFADSLETFILSYSLFTGFGLGLMVPTTFMAVNSYFSSKRGRAVGYSLAGTGVGQMLLPQLIQYLLDEYGFRGTVLILAGISANSLVAATLYQPAEWHMKRDETDVEEEEDEGKEKEKENGKEEEKETKKAMSANPIVRRFSEPQNQSSVPLQSKELDVRVEGIQKKGQLTVGKEKSEKRDSSIWRQIIQTMGWDLLGDLSFLNLGISMGMVYSANMCFAMLFPFYMEGEGYSKTRIAACMSASAASDILGRLVIPAFTDKFKLRSKTVFFFGAVLSAIIRSVLVTQNEFLVVMSIAFMVGFVRSAIICNFSICISDHVASEKLASGLGLFMVFKGVTVMLVGPITGFLRDSTHSYSLVVHASDIFLLGLPFSVWLIGLLINKYVKR